MKKDKDKTKEQLIGELASLRRRITQLTASKAERKQAEENTRVSEIRYYDLFNNMSSGVAVYEARENGEDFVFKDFNHAGEQIDQVKKEDIIGKSVTRAFPGVRDFGLFDVFQRVWRTGNPERFPVSMYQDKRIIGWRDNYVYRLPSGEIIAVYDDVTEKMQMEKVLRESEDKYRTLFESSLTGSFVSELGGKILSTNKAGAAILGFDQPEDVVGRSILDFYKRPEYREHIITEIKNGGIHSFEFEIVMKDGTDKTVLISAFIIQLVGERVLLTSVMDITMRKQTEEILQREKDYTTSILNSVPDMILALNQNAEITYINVALAQFVGIEPGEFLGRPLEQTIKKFELLIPESVSAVMERAYKRLQTGETTSNIEIAIRNPKGEWFPCIYSASGIKGSSGEVLGIVVVINNVSERKQAEKELREAYNIIDRSAIVAFLWKNDAGWPVEYVSNNVKDLFGYTAEEFTSGKVLYAETVHPDDLNRVTKEGNNFSSEEGRERFIHKPYRILARGGKEKWVSGKTEIKRDSEGKITHYQGVIEDVTERKQAEAERIELEQKAQLSSRLASIGEMASGIAHEINNPLAGVIGYSQLLMQKDTSKDTRDDVKLIHDNAQRVAGIVKGLLTFARQSKPERDYVSINEIIENTLALRAYSLKTNNIAISTRLDPELPMIIADGSQLQQVLLNIIVNAETEMKLARGMGNLSIKTERIDDTIRISCKDDGPGIARKHMDRIFDPFFTTRKVGQGTGLGLSVCHGIIAEHNGQLYVESTKGSGATFIVELPIVTEPEQLELAEPDIEQAQIATEARILVVDDEPVVLSLLSQLLSNEGHRVDTIDNAGEALKMLDTKRYSLILLDIKMPGMSGIEFYKHLQKRAASLARRTVLITGDVMGADTRQFLSRTKAHYITKPFDAEQLKKEINRILAEGT